MLVLPVLIHQCVPSTVQASMQAIVHVESRANPLALALNLKKAISAYNTGNFYSRFHHGFVNRMYANTKTTLLALNDSDVPPIVAVKTENDTSAMVHTSTSSDTGQAPANPYSSRSLLYIQQRKPTPNELNSIKGT